MAVPRMQPGGSAETTHTVISWADPAHGPAIWVIFSFFACIVLAQWLYIRHLTKPEAQ